MSCSSFELGFHVKNRQKHKKKEKKQENLEEEMFFKKHNLNTNSMDSDWGKKKRTQQNSQKNSKHIIRIERGVKKNMQIGLGFGFQGSRITTSANRSILFNILINRLYVNFNDLTCADLSCGSGIVGFEMLSSGAKKCFFLDCDKWKLKNILSANEKLNLNIETIYCFLPNVNGLPVDIDIIFFDPPYENDFCKATINEVFNKKILNKDGIMIVETKEELQSDDNKTFDVFHVKYLKNGAKFYFLANKNSKWSINKTE